MRQGGLDGSTIASAGGLWRALGQVRRAARPVARRGSTGDSAGRKSNVRSVGALRRTGRRRKP